MNRSRFLTVSFVLIILFLFIKIYQHNKILNLICEKQCIEQKKEELGKKRNELLVKLYQMKEQHLVCMRAQKKLGMQPLKPSQIVTVTFLEQSDYKEYSLLPTVTNVCLFSDKQRNQTTFLSSFLKSFTIKS